jgi:hypothetical protein
MDIQQPTEERNIIMPAKPGFLERMLGRRATLFDKIVLGVFLLVFLFVSYISLDANKYYAQVRVLEGEGRVGVNPTDQALDFGDLSRGTSAVRRVEIQNNTPVAMYIMVLKFGSIASLVDISDNFFTLDARQAAKIEFSLYMPASAEIERTYTGRVILFKIPKPF